MEKQNIVELIKVHPKNEMMSLFTHVVSMRNTKDDILQNVGNQTVLVTIHFFLCCSEQKMKVIQVWNDTNPFHCYLN